jgi:hypothetical protein
MNNWTGINRAESALEPGYHHLQNVRFTIHGECGRRSGMEFATASNGTVITNTWDPINGALVLLFTTSGTLELVAL